MSESSPEFVGTVRDKLIHDLSRTGFPKDLASSVPDDMLPTLVSIWCACPEWGSARSDIRWPMVVRALSEFRDTVRDEVMRKKMRESLRKPTVYR